MTKYRMELNVALSQYLSTIIDLNTNFKLHNANTIWYLQFHLECAKLCMSFIF